MIRWPFAAFLPLLLLAAPSGAQTAAYLLHIRGTAFDSLNGRPLAGALVSISGTSRSAITDRTGWFQMDSVSPGTYRFVLQHDMLDSLGMSGAATKVVITDGLDPVSVAVPSFATLWRVACHGAAVPHDSGFMFGTVRDAVTQRPVRGADIVARWLELVVDAASVGQHRWRLDAESDSSGTYALCGIPMDAGIRLMATAGNAASGEIDLVQLDPRRIQRLDLMVGPVGDAARGIVAGRVTARGDQPAVDARVTIDGRETRADHDGRFVLDHVSLGTRQVEARAVGLQPVTTTITVTAGDTARVDFSLFNVSVLEAMRPLGINERLRLAADFDVRRRGSYGGFADSSTIGTSPDLLSFLRRPPFSCGLTNGRLACIGGATCAQQSTTITVKPRQIWLDRAPSTATELLALRPQDVAAIEYYSSVVPADLAQWFRESGTMAPNGCANLIVWTKRMWPAP